MVEGQGQADLSLFASYPKLAEGAREVGAASGKAIVAVFPLTSTADTGEDLELEREIRRARDAFQKAGCAVFPTVDRALKALARVAAYQEYRKKGGS